MTFHVGDTLKLTTGKIYRVTGLGNGTVSIVRADDKFPRTVAIEWLESKTAEVL